MKELSDVKKIVNQRLVRNVNYIMRQRDVNANMFCEYCQQKYQIKVNQGNLWKALKGEVKIDVLLAQLLCEWLDADMKSIVWREMSLAECVIERNKLDQHHDVFVMTNENREFDKYNGLYYCYFYPTVSGEERLICGTVCIKICSYTHKCDVIFEIDTHTKTSDGKSKYIKKYSGSLMLSKKKDVCYAIVSNEELGECNLLMFRHVVPSNKAYIGGMAAVLTISAGGTNVPTFHRMLISRKKIAENDMKLIKGYLYLNWSRLMIDLDKLDEILTELDISQEIKRKIHDNSVVMNVCEISERYLRSLQKKDIYPYTHTELSARIRERSISLKYNKISKRLDDHIVEILESMDEQ